METKKIYDEFLKYFSPEEFFSPKAYDKYKHLGSYFFLSRLDIRLIKTLLVLRTTLNLPFTINNYKFGGRLTQRGVRDTSTALMKDRALKNDPWLSAHSLAMGVDFDVKGMTATEVRSWIKENKDLLPFKVRLERRYKGKEISWVHLDVCDDPRNPKVYEFDV